MVPCHFIYFLYHLCLQFALCAFKYFKYVGVEVGVEGVTVNVKAIGVRGVFTCLVYMKELPETNQMLFME